MARSREFGSGVALAVALASLGMTSAAQAADSYTATVGQGRHLGTANITTHTGSTPQDALNYNVVPGAPGAPIYNILHASATDAEHGTAIAQVNVPAPGDRDTVLGTPYYYAESTVEYTLRVIPKVQSVATVYAGGNVVAQIPVHVAAHGEASYRTSGGAEIQGFGAVAEFSMNQCTDAGCDAQTFDRRAFANNNPFAPAPVPDAFFDVDQTINFIVSAPDLGVDSPVDVKLYAYAVNDVVFYPTRAGFETYPGSAYAKVDPTFTIDDPRLAALYDIVGIPAGDAGPGAPAAVPEPASWAMMLSGFGLLGAALRHRRRMPARA